MIKKELEARRFYVAEKYSPINPFKGSTFDTGRNAQKRTNRRASIVARVKARKAQS